MRSIMKTIFIIFLFQLNLQKILFVISQHIDTHVNSNYNPDTPFSGFYVPSRVKNVSFEQYAGAWFGSIERVFVSVRSIETILNLEGSSYSVVRYKDFRNLMTRDYFDFHINHVSSSSNAVRPANMPLYYDFARNRLQGTIETLSKTTYREPDIRLYNQSIAVIPFSVRSGSPLLVKNKYQQAIRILYFQATFWSIHRYIPHIVVTVAVTQDLEILTQMGLPIWHIADMRVKFNESAVRREPGSSYFLPKESLLYLMANLIPEQILEMMNSTTIRTRNYEQFVRQSGIDFKYIYFTEADQILYMRHTKHIMDSLSSKNTPLKSQLIIPHRMHNFILPSDAPYLREQKFFVPIRERMLDQVKLEVENGEIARGSCCDDGRFVFPKCKVGFWHYCIDWGLRNYTTWLKYGDSGMTFFTGSAHQAKCSYSRQRRVCDIPVGCEHRTPLPQESASKHFYEDCGEVSPPLWVEPYTG